MKDKVLRFEFDVTFNDVDIGMLEDIPVDLVLDRIRQAVKAISKSKELRNEYAKCFGEELGAHVDSYVNALKAINDGLSKARIVEIEEDE